MTIANFTVTKQLDRRINALIKDQGFSSKAEFFRFAIYNYFNILNGSECNLDKKYKDAMDDLAKAIAKNFKGKKLPTLEEQLADLK